MSKHSSVKASPSQNTSVRSLLSHQICFFAQYFKWNYEILPFSFVSVCWGIFTRSFFLLSRQWTCDRLWIGYCGGPIGTQCNRYRWRCYIQSQSWHCSTSNFLFSVSSCVGRKLCQSVSSEDVNTQLFLPLGGSVNRIRLWFNDDIGICCQRC